MKKLFRSIAAVALAATMVMPFAACAPEAGIPGGSGSGGSGDKMFGENEFYHDGIDRDFSFDEFENYDEEIFEADTGELVRHRYEAENLRFTGTSWGGSSFGHACIAQSFQYNPDFSGSICLKNINNGKFMLTIDCDKDVRVPIEMCISNTGETSLVGTPLIKHYSITNTYDNRKHNVDVSQVLLPDGATQITTAWFCMVPVRFEINLHKGENKIEFNGSYPTCNFDYVDIFTSATLSENKTPSEWFTDPAKQMKVTAPTEHTKGAIGFVCTDKNTPHAASNFATVPALNDPDYPDYYTVNRIDEETCEWRYTIAGQDIVMRRDEPYIPEGVPDGESLGNRLTKDGVNYYDFFAVDPAGNPGKEATKGWYDFANKGEYGGTTGVPTLVENGEKHLEFTDASRIELFYGQASDGNYYHLGDRAPFANDTPATSLYGYEFLYDFTVSANGKFSLDLQGLSGTAPIGAGCGTTFIFDGNRITMHMLESSAEVMASATLADTVDFGSGTKYRLTFSIVRNDYNELRTRLWVNGAKVLFESTEDMVGGSVENGTIVSMAGYGYGQRLSVIPLERTDGYSTVNIWSLDIKRVGTMHTITIKNEDGQVDRTERHVAGVRVELKGAMGYQIEGRAYGPNDYEKGSYVIMPDEDITVKKITSGEIFQLGGDGRFDQFGTTITTKYDIVEGYMCTLVELVNVGNTTNAPQGDPNFRFKTGFPNTTGDSFNFTYIFYNCGEKDLSFEIYYRGNSADLSEVEAFQVEVKAGQQVSVETHYNNVTGYNDNLLTYFRGFTAEDNGAKFGVRLFVHS